MKQKLFAFAVCGVFVLSGVGSSVFALESAAVDGSTASTASQAEQISKRVAERKAQLKTRLTAVMQATITGKCKASQTLLSAIKKRDQAIYENRKKQYQDIADTINAFVAKLEQDNVSTVEIKSVMASYKTKFEKFKQDYTTYIQALDDLIAMDCVSDPTGFKATLEGLRSQRQVLAADAKDIKSLKPQLVKVLANAKIALANSQNGSNN